MKSSARKNKIQDFRYKKVLDFMSIRNTSQLFRIVTRLDGHQVQLLFCHIPALSPHINW